MDFLNGNAIQRSQYLLLHVLNSGTSPCCTKVKFGSTPVLFNKVQFTVVFGVKVTEVAVLLNKLLKF
jgi:hypothetical protein